jgi:hypothetical protein
MQATTLIQSIPPEHEIRAVANRTLDSFSHVENHVLFERLLAQAESRLDVSVVGLDRADGEMHPVDGQGESALASFIGWYGTVGFAANSWPSRCGRSRLQGWGVQV